MENAWQAKCAPTLASSRSSVASSVQVPSQISRNQIETNVAYHIQLHDVRQFQAPVMAKGSSSSSTPVSGSCTGCPDMGNSFLALLSGPPSELQSDFQHTSNLGLTHDPRDHNPGSGMDVCPLFSSRVLASSRRGVGLVSHGDMDTIRPFVAHAGCGYSDARNFYFRKDGYKGSSNASTDRTPHGSNSSTSQKSPTGLSSFLHDQPSAFMSISHVFCMNKSRELLLSNAGLLAVVCSCHGLHMSISNFCEHSGLSNVTPGYAVHMDTGETIAQWRRIYFSKLGGSRR